MKFRINYKKEPIFLACIVPIVLSKKHDDREEAISYAQRPCYEGSVGWSCGAPYDEVSSPQRKVLHKKG